TVLMDITPDGSNAFVASFTEDGDLRFARDIGGDPYGEGYALTVDTDDNLYTTGYVQSPDIDYLDGIFVEGYTLEGDLAFSHLLGSVWVDFPPYYAPSGGSGRAIATDAAGNVIVKGRFFGILDFDPDPDASTYLTSAQPQDPSYTDPFVASYT